MEIEMPIMDVRYAAGSLDKAAKADLAARLTDVLIQMEGGANTPGGRAFAWVLFTEAAETDFWVAGEPCQGQNSPKFLVHISIPEGYMNRAHKNEVHAWVSAAIREVVKADAAATSVLTIIDEVTEGNWGSRGQPISLESISATVGQAQDGPRLRWSRRYFEAKARVMTGAGYPVDAGGMLPSLSSSGQ
jgi:phenylpyruvate tautomerase PptA (4-oxalocrotonate tautomerase family)